MKPGRFVSIPVYTLSFKEYLDFKSRDSRSERELLEEYIRFGGFPIIALGNYDEQSACQIVNGIYHTVISRDIVKRHRINRQDLFDRVVKFISERMRRKKLILLVSVGMRRSMFRSAFSCLKIRTGKLAT